MLRCATCGGVVSEWAARCPVCHHPADDAVEDPADQESRTAASAPPAPGHRPRRRRHLTGLAWAGAAAVVAVVALIAVAAVDASAPGGHRPLGGRVLSWTATGSMVASTAQGARTEPIPLIPGTGLFLASDGRFLASGTGRELTLQGDALAGTGRQVAFIGPPGSWRAVDFADDDQALVATEEGLEGQTLVEVATFGGARPVLLGSAQSVAGDPRAVGVFAVDTPTGSDPRVERRDAGAPPVVLATAPQLLGDLHEGPEAPVALSVLPDPLGDKVAVIVVPAGVPAQPTGLVVLNRSGRLLGTTLAPFGSLGRPAWSPSGASLAYNASGPQGPAIALWSVGHPPTIRRAPPGAVGAGTTFGDCIWAVRGDDFLCADSNDNLATSAWLIGAPGHTPLSLVYGPALPLAWLWD